MTKIGFGQAFNQSLEEHKETTKQLLSYENSLKWDDRAINQILVARLGIYRNPIYNFFSGIIMFPVTILSLGWSILSFPFRAIPIACSCDASKNFGTYAGKLTITAELTATAAANLITLGCAGAGYRYYYESHKETK